VHLVEQVPLYQTVYLSILVHSGFVIKFFVHSHWVVLRIAKESFTQKFLKMFEISKDSDAVFDEDSDCTLGLMIGTNNDDKSSIFRKKIHKLLKCENSISPISQRKLDQILIIFLLK
jgi:hypothetical protein